MPHLLSLMEVDALGASIDWATVFVYTCSKSCDTEKKGFVEEFLWKQDFRVIVEDQEEEEKKVVKSKTKKSKR
jgi:hypothetical protein